jgi:hypothetical protein
MYEKDLSKRKRQRKLKEFGKYKQEWQIKTKIKKKWYIRDQQLILTFS